MTARSGVRHQHATANRRIAREAFGRALRDWMPRSDLTQAELQRRIGNASYNTISNWLTGMASPSDEHLAALVAMGFEPPAQEPAATRTAGGAR